jgi:hypothetical protein
MRAWHLAAFGVVVFLGGASTAGAVPCAVPSGSHPTIQSAVDDVGCTEIELGSQIYVESVTIARTLSVSGVTAATTTIAGRVLINGATAVVTLTELTVDGSHPAVAGCFVEAVDVENDGRMVGSNIVVVNGDGDACLLFGDGFEDGTTGAWSGTTP